jgi:hypothetical protein
MNGMLPRDGLGWLLFVFGVISLGNAVWMLAAPYHWYLELPAAVPDFGAFNPHFVRDIGCAFVTIGTALVWAALSPAQRVPLVVIATIFYGAHAALHVFDTLRAAVEPGHLLLDFPGVYLPAILLFIALRAAQRREGATR